MKGSVLENRQSTYGNQTEIERITNNIFTRVKNFGNQCFYKIVYVRSKRKIFFMSLPKRENRLSEEKTMVGDMNDDGNIVMV